MGNFKSKPTPSLDGSSSSSTTTKSRAIDKQIRVDQKRMKKEVKLLLLGRKASSCASSKDIHANYYYIKVLESLESLQCWSKWG